MRSYAGDYPATARKPITHLSNRSGVVCFGIKEAKPIVAGRPGYKVSGTNDQSEWQDPKFSEFLTYVGQAKSSRAGRGVECYLWRNQYWVRAVRSDRKALIRYSGGCRVSYVLLPIAVPSDFASAASVTQLPED